MVVYYDVNFDHQFVKDTQFIRKRVLEVAHFYQKSNAKFAISNEDEYMVNTTFFSQFKKT